MGSALVLAALVMLSRKWAMRFCSFFSDIATMVTNFNKEMFFQLSCFWPPQEVKNFAEEHNLLAELEEKRSRSIGSPPSKIKTAEASKVQRTGQGGILSTAPTKASRSAEGGPIKPSRGAEGAANINPLREESLKRSDRVLGKKKTKTLADVAREKADKNPFADDDDEDDDDAHANNPFLDDDYRNPFEEKEASNPFLDECSTNPFLDEDNENEASSNPFLD